MNIRDLSIGDLVRIGECGTHKGEYAKIAALTSGCNYIGLFNTCHFEECEDDIDPISISGEILERNGFVRDKRCSSRWIFDCASNSVYVTAPRGYAYVTIYRKTLHGFRRIIDTLQIGSVHELQHALRLSGINKEFEL